MALVLLAAFVCAGYLRWTDSQLIGLNSDNDIVDNGGCDVHEWQGNLSVGPFSTSSRRITRLQFNTNLHYLPTNEITHYSRLAYVDTIVISDDSTLMSDRVLLALNSFPRLQTVITPRLRGKSKEDTHGCSLYHDLTAIGKFDFKIVSLKAGEAIPDFAE